MFPIRTNPAGVKPVDRELTTMLHLPNGAEMYLLNEALSKVRMLRPQAGRSTTSTEATRSARTVAMSGRARSARELGVL
ncbi:hypothetical protein SAMN05443287_103261 [Micromonospora phaseoli]|uniref:Uncharacterized protein n=1 Tax=Micromonospora phaseoli TaxID=1144548 RepID=A0A1H6WNK1_9ACTN|nr:hypothetical protein CLV64_102260 [Micromonospora phaseoli]GIJ80663.1 hypothetical protein Xph01_50950 [Micromonospora phaseoli]SEJ18601.1 hypothetical protein SAMN05443287_103261 [Micromonospora phaseoli]